jgi:ribosome-binding factor A
MDSTRLQRISRLLQKELSIIFQKKNDIFLKSIISVTVVRVSDDLSQARAYISVFPTEKTAEVLSLIQLNSKTIRYELSQILKNQLRKMPELSYFIDDSLDYAAKIDQLLK